MLHNAFGVDIVGRQSILQSLIESGLPEQTTGNNLDCAAAPRYVPAPRRRDASMDLSQLLGGLAPSLGFGGVAGLVVGYTAKKVTKLVALALGLVFIVVQLLAYEGLLTVNWDAVQSTAENVWTGAQGATLANRAWEMLTANLPFGGAFAAGFALGLKLG